MTFEEAAECRIPFGKHAGSRIDDVASTDEGLLYLDWLSGRKALYGSIVVALDVYLRDSAIAKEIAQLVERNP